MTSPSVEGFVEAATEYCMVVAGHNPLTRCDTWRIRELLIRLLFHIPAVETHPHGVDFEGERIEDEEYSRITKRFGDFPFRLYRVVFDPHDFDAKDEPVVGLLSDDLADICRDLSEGLSNAKNGHIKEACFDWSQSYRTHWARHAVSALAAIELYRTDNCEIIEQSGAENPIPSGTSDAKASGVPDSRGL